MNRRGFLGALLASPVVAPEVAKGLVAEADKRELFDLMIAAVDRIPSLNSGI